MAEKIPKPAMKTSKSSSKSIPTSIADYIRAAPEAGQPHLRRLHALLKSIAPKAEEAIKWGTPFFIEPRFLFAFSACKAHCNFAPTAKTLDLFRKDLTDYGTTKEYLQIRYDQPLPEDLIRKIAEQRVREVAARDDDSFW